MFKQISHIIIAVLLFVFTSGFTVHQHYCLGNLVETSVFHVPEFCCGDGASCCNNESETYQLDEDSVFFNQFIDLEEVVIELPALTFLFIGPWDIQSNPLSTSRIFYPPDKSTVLARLQVFCL